MSMIGQCAFVDRPLRSEEPTVIKAFLKNISLEIDILSSNTANPITQFRLSSNPFAVMQYPQPLRRSSMFMYVRRVTTPDGSSYFEVQPDTAPMILNP